MVGRGERVGRRDRARRTKEKNGIMKWGNDGEREKDATNEEGRERSCIKRMGREREEGRQTTVRRETKGEER